VISIDPDLAAVAVNTLIALIVGGLAVIVWPRRR
jgi:hypothetical protein